MRTLTVPGADQGTHNRDNAVAQRVLNDTFYTSRILPYSFSAIAVHGSSAYDALSRVIADAGAAPEAQAFKRGVVLPWQTGLAGVALLVSSAVTTGNLQFQITADGDVVGDTLQYDSASATGSGGRAFTQTFDSSDINFDAGVEIRVQMQANSYGATSDLEFFLYLARYDE